MPRQKRQTLTCLTFLCALVCIFGIVAPRQRASGFASADADFCHPAFRTSFGLYRGELRESLQPLDLLGIQGAAAWPLANPIITASHVVRRSLGFNYDGIAAPCLFPRDGRLFLFHEVTSCSGRRRAVAVAESIDGGVTWRHGGSVLESTQAADALHRPFLLSYNLTARDDGSSDTSYTQSSNEEIVMFVDGEDGVSLYRAVAFPLRWEFNQTLTGVQHRLRGVSVIRDPSSTSGQWLMIGSVESKQFATHHASRRRLSPGTSNAGTATDVKEDFMVAMYVASSPYGPWKPRYGSPYIVEAAAYAGGLFPLSNGEVVRLGRTCKNAVCAPGIRWSKLEIFSNASSAGSATPQPTRSTGTLLATGPWRQQLAWDGGGHTSAALAPSSSGGVVAIVTGQTQTTRMLTWRWSVALDATTCLCEAMACAMGALAAGMLLLKARIVRAVLYTYSTSGVVKGCGGVRASYLRWKPRCPAARPPLQQPSTVAPERGWALRRGWVGGIAGWVRFELIKASAVSPHRVALAAVLTCLFVAAALALGRIRAVLAPFWQPASPVMVAGTFSRFTLMVMSYEKRKSLLTMYVNHYSRCPSVGEILIVWNSGIPPDPSIDFPGAAVPIRVRKEASNSMNNRYRPDGRLRYRAVLSLDDDTMIPCADIEHAFARWRENPSVLVGFYPRLAEEPSRAIKAAIERGIGDLAGGEDADYRYLGEPATIQRKQYNLILSGAAFVDSRTYFPAYFSPELTAARAFVDKVVNCDDLLMNFVVANATLSGHMVRGDGDRATAGSMLMPPAVQYYRPSRRLDLSHWSGVGLSHAVQHFVKDAELCLQEFSAKSFAKFPLRPEAFDWSGAVPPQCTNKHALDCSYLS